MIFRQLFEPVSCTYTYLIGCSDTRQAILIDPVLERLDADLALLSALDLRLAYTLETHIHADHVTSAASLRATTGCLVACPAMDELADADLGVSEVDALEIGTVRLQPLYTPGHTDTHHSYLIDSATARVMTGDALFVDGCGRTDFQGGDAEVLYRSVHGKILSLPDDTLVYPGHDYQNRHVSTVAQERERNPRLGGGKTIEEFVSLMGSLDLPRPKKIDIAVPANKRCGRLDEEHLPTAG